MGRLIDADALMKALGIADECRYCSEDEKGIFCKKSPDFRVACQTITDAPTIDAAPVVHSRWIELKDGSEECTNCRGLCPHEENYNGDIIFNFDCDYCPWCGAKMDLEG